MAATPAQIQYQLAHRDEDLSHQVLGGIITVAVLATLAVVLRFVNRMVNGAKILGDDYFVVAALVRTLPFDPHITEGPCLCSFSRW